MDTNDLKPSQLLIGSTLLFAAVGLVSWLLLSVGQFSLKWAPQDIMAAERNRMVYMALLATGISLGLSYWFYKTFASFKAFRHDAIRMFYRLPWWGVFYLAIFTAVVEEVFFRGALQGYAGLVLTAAFYGIHIGRAPDFLPVVIYGVLIGLLYGAITEVAGSLYPAILAHMISNLAYAIEVLVTGERRMMQAQGPGLWRQSSDEG